MTEETQYYSHVRDDILSHVPKGVRRVLSVGCGRGCTEAELVARGVEVTGVELNPDAAKVASQAGINVICGDASENSAALAAGPPFDCLIYADVLEHIQDPESVLKDHLKFLVPGSIVIVSVPNFRHYSVFSQLFLKGHIRYTDAGILDRTHVRMTTRRMIEEWFAGVGLAVTKIEYRIYRRRDRLLSMLSFGWLREFLASQVIIVGQGHGKSPMVTPHT